MDREREGFDRDFDFIEECRGGVIENSIWREWPVTELLHDVRDGIADPPRVREDADGASFVIGDREFIQGADATGDEDHGIARTDIDDVPVHEPESCVDQDVVVVRGHVFVHVFVLGKRRRNADHHASCFLRAFRGFIGNAGACAIYEDVPALRNLFPHGSRFLHRGGIFYLGTGGRADDANFKFHG